MFSILRVSCHIIVRLRGMGTGISEASKRVPIFSFTTQGGPSKQVSSCFWQRNCQWVQVREAQIRWLSLSLFKLRERSIYWEQRQSKNPKQSLRFCTAEELRLTGKLPKTWAELRWEKVWDRLGAGKCSHKWIFVLNLFQYRTSVYTGQLYCLSSWPQSERGESPLLRR